MNKLHWNSLHPFMRTGYFLALTLCFASCIPPVIRKAPEGKPYIIKNSVEVKGENLSKTEKSDLQQRLYNQIDDSAVVTIRELFLLFRSITSPPAYDSMTAVNSLTNMKASLFHLGYYGAKAEFNAEQKGRQVHVMYEVEPGTATIIKSLTYSLGDSSLQRLAESSRSRSFLAPGKTVTKAAVLQEINRLVDSFRNNGYYKFSAAELKVKGDTSIAPLSSPPGNVFEQVRLIAMANAMQQKPGIDLTVALVPPADSTRMLQFRNGNVNVFTDFRRGDQPGDDNLSVTNLKNITLYDRRNLFKPSFVARNIFIKQGDLYRQEDFNRTFTALNRTGVWQSINMAIRDDPDSSGKTDVQIELIPSKKLGFQTGLEASYLSANNATSALGGNLFGLSMNFSLLNRNIAREAIRMTHTFRAGIELNNNRGVNTRLISSQEFSYANNIVFPKLVFPKLIRWVNTSGESFTNTNVAFNSRLALFDLQAVSLNFGWNAYYKRNPSWKVFIRPLNIEFSNLFNQTDSFKNILAENPFLNYSYNTAYVTGMSFGLSNYHSYARTPFSRSKERYLRLNLEESGLTWGNLPFFRKYLRRFVKFDVEWKYTVKYPKTILAFRSFIGVGVPLLGSDTNRTLPFFKQFFGGGVNSMRGWPARGIGIGGQQRIPFNSSRTLFNDRTGDLQFEANIEYRYDIARIIPNTLTLRGAIFADIGNIWNVRDAKLGIADSAQFRISNFYSQMGVSAGTGFRIDFNYVVLRLDLGFRFKRPDLFYENNGWKAPEIGFDDFLKKIFTKGPDDEYRQWRYENFNFVIGISYPF